jgi:dipeptidyl aminopeptidase/acylaminoacyl peptidase
LLRKAFGVAVGLVSVLAAGVAAAAPPLEAFVVPHKISSPELSPDGSHLAFARRNDNGTTTLIIVDLSKPGSAPVGLNMPAGSVVGGINWKDSKRAIASLIIGKDIYLGDAGHVDLPSGPKIVAFDADGKNLKTLVDLSEFQGPRGYQFVHTLPQDPQHVLMGLVDRLGRLNLHRVNVYDGDDQEVAQGNKYTYQWVADRQGNPRVRWEQHFYTTEMWVRNSSNNEWELATSYASRGFPEKRVIGFADDPAISIVADRNGGDRYGIYEYNLATRTFGRLLLDHPNVDVGWPQGGPTYDGYTGALAGVCFPDDVWFCRYFDPQLNTLQQQLEATFKGASVVRMTSWSTDRKRFVVFVSGPSNPGAYYIYDADKSSASALGKVSPQLLESELGEQLIIKYPARDGTKIPAYLTLPPGRPGKNLPLVVMPHGGPETRDVSGYDHWVQMFASRGYAVLQPNFRGSGGYGKRYTQVGYRQWGRLMQDDVSDGVKALIKDGTADANRVCIVGASYGGYAALAGGAFTPELYKCVVAVAGVSDIAQILKDEEHTGNPKLYEYWKQWLGDPKTDMAEIKSISPVNFASKFTSPVLLIHGKADLIVRPGQSMVMKRALTEAGKSAELILVDFEGHPYFFLQKNELMTLREMERFVGANIGK